MIGTFKIKESFWTLGDEFWIRDGEDQDCFQVKGKFFSWGDNLSFRDVEGNELLRIRQKMFRWMPTYEIEVDGEVVASLQKKWSWFKENYFLDVPGPNDYVIQGDFWNREYEFIRQEKAVARVSRRLWSISHTYGVEVREGAQVAFVLAAVIIIDLIRHD